MAYLLDTSIAIHARDRDAAVLNRLEMHSGVVVLSALTLVELQRGLHKEAAYTLVRKAGLESLLKRIPVLSFDMAAAESYGRIIAQLGWVKGRDYDRMIAAHAISTASILVTSNESDFRDVPGLKIENWALG